jgi:hypothetical protein
MAGNFTITHTKGNKDNTLPQHWDVTLKGQEDSIATIWESEAMANQFVEFLEAWSARKDTEAARKNDDP